MKVVFYSIDSLITPHFEIDLELISDHIEKGDEVYLLKCNGELESCYVNTTNNKLVCNMCKSRLNLGFKKIGFNQDNIIDVFDKNVNYDVIPKSFDNIDELKDFKYDNADLGMAVASTLISKLRDHRFDTKKHKKLVYKNLKASYLVYISVLDKLKSINPDAFYLFNGRFTDYRPAFRAAEKLGITIYAQERAGTVNRYMLYKDCFPHDIDFAKNEMDQLWEAGNDDKETLAKQWFYERRGGKDQAWFSFTKNQVKGSLPDTFDKEKTNVVIFNSSEDEFAAIQGWENPIYKDQNDGIRKIAQSLSEYPDINLHIRVHPNLGSLYNTQIKQLKDIESLNIKNLNIIWSDNLIDTYELLDNSHVVLSFGSTIGLEACFWDKPSILLGRSYYEDLGCCYMPKSHEEVIDLIRSDIQPKDKMGALKFSYRYMKNGIPYKKYKPLGITKGEFMGEQLKVEPSKKLEYALYKIYLEMNRTKRKLELKRSKLFDLADKSFCRKK